MNQSQITGNSINLKAQVRNRTMQKTREGAAVRKWKYGQVQHNCVFLWFTLLTVNWFPLNQTIDWIDSFWYVCRQTNNVICVYDIRTSCTRNIFQRITPSFVPNAQWEIQFRMKKMETVQLCTFFQTFIQQTASLNWWISLFNCAAFFYVSISVIYVAARHSQNWIFKWENENERSGAQIIINGDQMGSKSGEKKIRIKKIDLAFIYRVNVFLLVAS